MEKLKKLLSSKVDVIFEWPNFFVNSYEIHTAMTIILKKGISFDKVDEQIKSAKSSHKKPDMTKYAGTIKLKEDPLVIQKRMRDEWD